MNLTERVDEATGFESPARALAALRSMPDRHGGRVPSPGRAYYSRATRPDGVVVHLRGGPYNTFDPPLPHDIAHLVVESGLGLRHGVWGLLEAGGLCRLATVHAGHRKHRRRGGPSSCWTGTGMI